MVKRHLDEAMEIEFVPEARSGLRHFGQLRIKKFNESELDLAGELLAMGWARPTHSFRKG